MPPTPMLPLRTQIDQGRLVCPVTHRRLRVEAERLVTDDGARAYRFEDGVPVLLPEAGIEVRAGAAAGAPDGATHGTADDGGFSCDSCDSSMAAEYRRRRPPSRLLAAIDRFVRSRGDHRSARARRAFSAVIEEAADDALCVSVGGGPNRIHPRLVNLNIDRFDNVDVVGTAYRLPWADGSVDAIHCEAVLEHLEHPRRAVAEMFRILAGGGEVFAATPFLQAFHAYPDHFQNFTREGHDRLFRRAGFEVLDSGACVGPTFALTDLAALWCRHYLPGRWLSRGVQRLVLLASLPVRPLDRFLHRSPDAHLLASSVYARLRKP